MGMAERRGGGGKIRLHLMLSLDPASLGSEIFQVGETLDGFALIDRQHPHDFLMQGAVVWQRPLACDGRHTATARCRSTPSSASVHPRRWDGWWT
jgi:hypothetical protein